MDDPLSETTFLPLAFGEDKACLHETSLAFVEDRACLEETMQAKGTNHKSPQE